MIDFSDSIVLDDLMQTIKAVRGNGRGIAALRRQLSGRKVSIARLRTFLRYEACLNSIDADWISASYDAFCVE